MNTNYRAYEFEDGNKVERFVLKVTDDKIDDLLLVHPERAKPDECLEYRLDNGAIRAEYIGCGEDEFVSSMLRGRGEDCRFRKYNVKEQTFRDMKIGANMVTYRGESTGLRYLNACREEKLRHETRRRFNMAQLSAVNVK